MEDQLILVDTMDNEIGYCGKMEAHKKALLHRAFSIFIFREILADNPDGTRTFHNQLLIQKRAEGKYHSAGLWANSCCSHPRKSESLAEATTRRLTEETGLTVEGVSGSVGHIAGKHSSTCECSKSDTGTVTGASADVTLLEEAGAFIYKADFPNGLTEHEFDHVFVGWINSDKLGRDGTVEQTGTVKLGQPGTDVVLHPNPEEASEMCFKDVDEVMNDVLLNPAKYAAWFMPALLIATDGQEFGSLNKDASDRIIY